MQHSSHALAQDPGPPRRGVPRLALVVAVWAVVVVSALVLALPRIAPGGDGPPHAAPVSAPAPIAHDAFGDRILVIAPHPDDEVLGAAGLIRQAARAGKRVHVVVLTVGDGYRRAAMQVSGRRHPEPVDYRTVGTLRAEETRRALGVLGLSERDVSFLCYPDGAMAALWDVNWDRPRRGKNGATEAPYDFALQPGADYCGASVDADLEAIVREFRPSSVVYPDPADRHNDHWAGAAFTQHVLARTGFAGGQYTYLVHRSGFPHPLAYRPEAPLEPPASLASVGTSWHALPLTAEDVDTKRRAVEAYASQVRSLRPLMYSMVRRTELFGTYAPSRAAIVAEPGPDDLDACAVLCDPVADVAERRMHHEADVSTVSFASGETTSFVGLVMGGGVSRGVDHALHGRLVGPAGERRFDILVSDGVARVTPRGRDAVRLPATLPLTVAGDRLCVALPSAALRDAGLLLLWADTLKAGVGRVDRTAVRPVLLGT